MMPEVVCGGRPVSAGAIHCKNLLLMQGDDSIYELYIDIDAAD